MGFTSKNNLQYAKNMELPFEFDHCESEKHQYLEKLPIESSFPIEKADLLARQESFNKHLFRPNTYLHKWWARRSGTTFRHILKQLSPKSERVLDYYHPGGLEGITVLDPMMGGGTTIHEAIRLGANVIGYDIDPIPVLQVRASLKDIPLGVKEKIFKRFLEKLNEKTAYYFTTRCPECGETSPFTFVLYALRKRNRSKEYLVVDSFLLREEINRSSLTLDMLYPDRIVKQKGRSWTIVDKLAAKENGLKGRDNEPLDELYINRYVPIVVTGECPKHKKFFKAIDECDLQLIDDAHVHLISKTPYLKPEDFNIPPGPKSKDLLARNINSFLELFTFRQLIYIEEAKTLLFELSEEHRLWMGILISTSLEFNSLLCGYKGAQKRRPGAVRHVFSHHAYSFPHTALENNPVSVSRASGSLNALFRSRIISGGRWAQTPKEREFVHGKWKQVLIKGERDLGEEVFSVNDLIGKRRCFYVEQRDSSKMPLNDQSVDFVVTDPPYFDSVQYSDLSHFFRCWLKLFLPLNADWGYGVAASAVSQSSADAQDFGRMLGNIWKECNRVIKRPHGRLIFTYHHWRVNAWVQLSIALMKAGMRLSEAYVIHSENPVSVHIRQLRALKHDCVFILQPIDVKSNKVWTEPTGKTPEESRAFCDHCAQTLGWVLQLSPDRNLLNDIWKKTIDGESNGEISI